jgi:hypothetical protein
VFTNSPPLVPISQDSVVDVATRYELDGAGFESKHGQEVFLFTKTSRPVLIPSQRPVQWVPGFFVRIKRPGREDDHSLPFRAKVRNDWSYKSSPSVRIHGVDRVTINFTDLYNEARNFSISVFNQTQAQRRIKKKLCDWLESKQMPPE